MAEVEPETNYPIFVTARDGVYDLRIRELLLKVSGPDLRQTYDELLQRKQGMIDYAPGLGSLDELPPPAAPPPLGTEIGSFGSIRRTWSRLRIVWERLF
jgi:hypothetical protein